MCIILDVNCFGKLMNRDNQDMEPVKKWIKRINSNIKMVSSQKVESEANRLKREY